MDAGEEQGGPVAEGMFSKKRPPPQQDPASHSDTPPAEVDAASLASGGPNGSGGARSSPSAEKGATKEKGGKDKIKRDKRNLLPRTKPEKVRRLPALPPDTHAIAEFCCFLFLNS